MIVARLYAHDLSEAIAEIVYASGEYVWHVPGGASHCGFLTVYEAFQDAWQKAGIEYAQSKASLKYVGTQAEELEKMMEMQSNV